MQMNPTLRNIIGIIVGIFIGGVVNMLIIMASGSVVPLPEGVDPNDMESIRENLHLYSAKHFIMPFLAHALGTLAGAFVAVKIAATRKKEIALAIGILFLAGGIAAATMIPAPTWFIILDLVVAYIPMALLAHKIGS